MLGDPLNEEVLQQNKDFFPIGASAVLLSEDFFRLNSIFTLDASQLKPACTFTRTHTHSRTVICKLCDTPVVFAEAQLRLTVQISF